MSSIAGAAGGSTWQTLRRGLAISPEFTRGGVATLAVALLSTAGRIAVPVAVQQTLDRGVRGPDGPRPGLVLVMVLAAAVGVLLAAVAGYLANVRIFRATEAGLTTLRTTAFAHVHDLSMLSQDAERRGALVARVTTDVDTISNFAQLGGLVLVLSGGQLLVATGLMAFYSWPLAIVVWAAYAPLFLGLPWLQQVVSRAYARVRERVGDLLGAVSESVVGAQTIRAYAIEDRIQARVDEAVAAHARTAVRAQVLVSVSSTAGVLVSGVVVAVVVGAGTVIGTTGWAGGLSLGRLVAFLFLVQLFTGPVQIGTEVLNELQNALAGWRRVIAVLDTPADVADPVDGLTLPRGPLTLVLRAVGYAYPGGPPVLRDVDLELAPGSRVAVVGETGSGKSTLAKLASRLIDPTQGVVLLDGTDLRRISFASLRARVVLVPQEGFLFDDTLLANLTWGIPGAARDGRPETARDARPETARDGRPETARAARPVTARAVNALDDLGLLDWATGLPEGLATAVGQRGESLSAGERQLVALARAYLADPDLLVLDEATSAVDPATELRLQRALDEVTRGRTSVTIAHRLSTAEGADQVVVMDAGRIVDVGPHAVLVERCEVYRRLHASWAAQQHAS